MNATNTRSLRAEIQPSGTIRIFRGGLMLGRIVRVTNSGDAAYWRTLVNSTSSQRSRKEFRTAEEAALARWGAAGRDAVRAAEANGQAA